MTVDLVIPTYKPDEKFKETLKRISKQTVPFRNIYLMNTEEQYFPKEYVKPYDNIIVTHISKSEFDHGGTRNYGASLSDADIICFMTQDAVPVNHHMTENLIKAFDDVSVGAAYGRQIADPKDNYLEYYTRVFNYPPVSRKKSKKDLDELGIKTFFCSNVCSAYRKKDYDAMGGFVLKTIFNEDMIMASKMIDSGKSVAYQSDAVVWHWHNYTSMEQLHRNFDLAVSQVSYGGLFEKVSSESEGVKMVLQLLKHLWKTHRYRYIPKMIADSGCKFIGYKFGKNYKKLPKKLIYWFTMNPAYWETKGIL